MFLSGNSLSYNTTDTISLSSTQKTLHKALSTLMTLCFHWTFASFHLSLFFSLTHSLTRAISFSLSFSTTNRNGHCYWVTYSILIPSDYKRFYNYYYPTYIATHHTARCYINANNNSRKSGAMISFSIFRLLFYIISDHQIWFLCTYVWFDIANDYYQFTLFYSSNFYFLLCERVLLCFGTKFNWRHANSLLFTCFD